MAGINRLGKAPPKPGTLRPPDPNKYRTVDMYSEGAEADMDYQKTVRDIEEMQQQQGWLFGRGAFDKADLLYLRDTAEQQRHMELELRDNERNQFAALRARMDQQIEDDHKPASTQRTRARDKAAPPIAKIQPKAVPLVVPKTRSNADTTTESAADEPPAKRGRPDPGRASESGPAGLARDRDAGKDDVSDSKSSRESGDDAANDGLLGLLGAYGSDSEDDGSDGGEQGQDEGSKEGHGNAPQTDSKPQSKPTIVLPSAAELLGL